ncbi:MAG: hypothetical protein M1828_002093 [Chrysothrix sp. TS-e1954]|nr:MAG: hypothetical protein M1828_002093 [Chrysothrix sp. TS-e1954]
MGSLEDRKYHDSERLPGVQELLNRPGPMEEEPRVDMYSQQPPRSVADILMSKTARPEIYPKPRTPMPPYQSLGPPQSPSYRDLQLDTKQPVRPNIPGIHASSSSNGESLSSSHSYATTPMQQHAANPLSARPELPSQTYYWETPETQNSKSPATHRSESHATSVEYASPPLANPHKHVVGVKEIPGHGENYVFSDASTVPTQINGDPVNPNWGITKAGKPRKRLAQACTECREKKVKCEPGETETSKCNHCSRLNRDCRRQVLFSNMNLSNATTDLHHPRRNEDRSSPERDFRTNGFGATERPLARPELGSSSDPSRTGTPTNSALYSRPAPPAPPYQSQPHEERRPLSSETRPMSSATLPMDSTPSTVNLSRPASERRGAPVPGPLGTVEHHKFKWGEDPYAIDPDVTMHFLELFFANRASRAYVVVPPTQFMSWVKTCRNKSPDDRMVVYAFAALGSIFTQNEALRNLGMRFGRIAEKAETARADHFTLQLAQTRAHIALFFFGIGRFETAFNHTQTARRAVQMLGYYQERTVCKIPENSQEFEYGLNGVQLMEARRRTFWVTYLLDRYNGFTFGCMGSIHDIQVFLRLPMNEKAFIEGNDVITPCFNGNTVREPFVGEPSDMAMLVGIITIYGLVTGHAYRAQNRSKAVYGDFYHSYCYQVQQKLDDWDSCLPDRYQYSAENTTRSIKEGYFGTYFVLHSVYCVVAMKMGRLGRYELLDDDIIRRNLCRSMYFARRYLKIVNELSSCIYGREARNPEIEYSLVQPFPGFVITSACDVVTSGGSIATLKVLGNNELENAKKVLTQIGRFWRAGAAQRNSVEERQRELSARVMSDPEGKTIRMTGVRPMDKSHLPDDHDMLYNVSDELFFAAIADLDAGSDGRTPPPEPDSPQQTSRNISRANSVSSNISRKGVLPMGDEVDMIDG